MITSNFRTFFDALRKQGGWVKKLDCQFDHQRCVIMTKSLPDERKLELQLWGDGQNRVSHWIRGGMNTLPTDFHTPAEMLNAIERETTRTDNWRLHGELPPPGYTPL